MNRTETGRTRRSLLQHAAIMAGTSSAVFGPWSSPASAAEGPATSDVFPVDDFQTGAGDRAAAQAAIDAAAAAAEAAHGSATVTFRGDKRYEFTDGGALKLPRNFAGDRLRILGSGARVALTAGCPRMFDFDWRADYDVFRAMDIDGFEVDAGTVDGYGHTLLGTLNGSAEQQKRMNVHDMTVRNVRLLNVSTSTVRTNRKCIWIAGIHDGPGETRTLLRDLVFEDLELDGGRAGIVIGGQFSNAASSSAEGVEVLIDGIEIRRCTHTLRNPPAGRAPSANFQIGDRGYGGTVVIADCRGSFSSDVGVEIDTMQAAVIERTEIIDPFYIGFTQNNFRKPTVAETQRFTVRDCTVRRQALVRVKGYGCGGSQNVTPPAVMLFDSCVFHSTCSEPAPVGNAMFSFLAAPRSVSIRDCTSVVENYVKETAGTAAQTDGVYFTPVSDGTTPLRIRGLKLVNRGRGSSGGLQWRGIYQQGGHLQYDVDGLEVDVSTTGLQRRGFRAIELVKGAARGTIKGVAIIAAGDDSSATGVQIAADSSLELDGPLRIIYCDFSGMPSTGTDVGFADDSNKPLVFFTGNRWRTFPRPAKTLAPGASPFVYRDLEGYPLVLNVAGGDVSKIELQRGSQAWADTGLREGQIRMECGDYVRLTYPTTAPKITAYPEV